MYYWHNSAQAQLTVSEGCTLYASVPAFFIPITGIQYTVGQAYTPRFICEDWIGKLTVATAANTYKTYFCLLSIYTRAYNTMFAANKHMLAPSWPLVTSAVIGSS